MSGAEASHDLRLFVEDVSDAANMRVEDAGEPVHTVEELSRLFNVSTKTISRWRQQGLVSRRFIFDGRKRVGFLRSSVEQFVTRNIERVKRGERFSQLTADERQEIVDRARRLAQAGGCPSEVARRIARQMGRSVETVRYTLKQFDDRYPDLAVFPHRSGLLNERSARRSISNIAAGCRSMRWPGGIAGRGPASIASSTKCGRGESWNCRWTTSAMRPSPSRTPKRRYSGRCRRTTNRRSGSHVRRPDCLRIWHPFTRLRC